MALGVKGLSLSLVKAHRSMLSAVFKFKLPELGEHHVLRGLLHSFEVERPHVPHVTLSWDFDVVLRHLMSSKYEPLGRLSLRALTKKAVFGCSGHHQEDWRTAGSFSPNVISG